MPRHSHTDSVENLLLAKRRDLTPLLEQSASAFELDHTETETMEDILSAAWRIGALLGQARALADLGGEGEETEGPDIEAELEPLLEQLITAFDFSLDKLISASTYLSHAAVAGAITMQAESMALAIEYSHDLGEEALEWLDERRDRR
ncbi:MAG TPA: hypothetical protein VFZ25_20900 [Chloroflexota bacterium]|nr:hypothetical protein [Chloroflexota bacterium]